VNLSNISSRLRDLNQQAKRERCVVLALNVALLLDVDEHIFAARLSRFAQLSDIGRWPEAESMWQLLDPMGRDWRRATYAPGDAEAVYVESRLFQQALLEENLIRAEDLARAGRNRHTIQWLHNMRGEWQLQRGEWTLAAESLHEAVRMAREVGVSNPRAEAQLALARLRLGQLPDPRSEAERLAASKEVNHRALAELWLAIDDREQATKHALAAYRRAWADGEPYVYRYGLEKAGGLLEQLGVEVPKLPPYDPARDEKLPWEDDVAAAIETLRAEKAAKERAAATQEERRPRRRRRS
jgi:hypothetical protein